MTTFHSLDNGPYEAIPITGPQGPQGPQGEQGPQGPQGLTGELSEESITTFNGMVSTATSAATTASSAATAAAASASSALTSQSSASTSATSASGSATTATTKAGEAASSASAAATSATNASTSATTATTKAGEASASATAAATSATNAGTSATSAAASATTANTSASQASTSATTALQFGVLYLGSKASNPTVDNQGNPLVVGAQYWNTTSQKVFLWNGSTWTQVALSAGDYLPLTGGTLGGKLVISDPAFSYDNALDVQADLASTSGAGTVCVRVKALNPNGGGARFFCDTSVSNLYSEQGVYNNSGTPYAFLASGSATNFLVLSAPELRIGTGHVSGERARLNSTGLGIFKTPSVALDVTGSIAASGTVRCGTYLVSTLPSASGSGAGARAYVTDANATTFASVVAGSGSNKVPVFSDGTNWRIG